MALLDQGGRQIAVALRVPGTDFERPAIVADGLFNHSPRLKHLAQVIVGLGIFGIDLQGVPVAGNEPVTLLDPVVGLQGQQVIPVLRRYLEPQVTHLIAGIGAVNHPLRRIVRIADILRRVVVTELHGQPGSSRQRNRLTVDVVVLPIEVPLLDVDEPAPAAVGKLRKGAHLFAQIVGMRVNTQKLHGHRQHITVFDPVLLLSRSNVDGLRPQPDDKGGLGRGLVTEIEPHAGLDPLRLARGHHVQFQHQVGAPFQPPGPAVVTLCRNLARRPPQKMAVGRPGKLGGPHAFETRNGIILIQLPAAAGRVDQSYRMVDDPRVAGPKLQGPYIPVRLQGGRYDEHPEDVRSIGRQGVGPGHGEDQVRFPQVPAGRPFRRLGRICRIPFDRPLGHPLRQHADLVHIQPALPDELPVTLLGLPGRHVTTLRDGHDLPGPAADVGVAEQVERARTAGPVTGCAVFEHQGRDVPVEGQGAGRPRHIGFQDFFKHRIRSRWRCHGRVRQSAPDPGRTQPCPDQERNGNVRLESLPKWSIRPVKLHRLTPSQESAVQSPGD